MVKQQVEKYIFVGLVAQESSNLMRSMRWIFNCSNCQQRMRFKPGAAEYDCPICRVSHKVLEDGRVLRVELVMVENANAIVNLNQALVNSSRALPKTGILGRLTGAVIDANETANGKRLLDGLNSTNQALRKLDGQIAERAIAGFLKKRSMLNDELSNWSNDGKIKMGKTLQDEARKKFDFNQAESYSLWLAGAWLESGARCSDSAASVHVFLERLAHDIEG